MQGDFSRFALTPAAPWTRVLFQQGRVQLDADLNEQTAVATALYRRLARDLIGDHGGPEDDLGFAITISGNSLRIGRGRYWVAGWPVENPESELPFENQAGIGQGEINDAEDAVGDHKAFLAYLEVWERLIVPIEAPDLLEPALGGVDTTARAQLQWQVRLLTKNVETVDEAESALAAHGSSGRLRARATAPGDGDGLCALDPEAAYRGLENQLYRVEMHRGGFKWSRENASVVFALLGRVDRDPTTLDLVSLGRDERYGLREGQWVELIDGPAARGHRSGQMARVEQVDPDRRRITLGDHEALGFELGPVIFVRRWEGWSAKLPTLDTADYIDLEQGVQIAFADDGARYREFDYWLIPARVGRGDILWPWDMSTSPATPMALAPHGPERVVAPLLHRSGGASPAEKDLRRGFPALAQPVP
jgi:Family of unknown function (DUF6519)